MKKLSALFLCFLFILLSCSCNKNDNKNTTSTQNATTIKYTLKSTTASSVETTKEEITKVNIPVNPNNPYSKFIKEKYEIYYEFLMEHDPKSLQRSVWYGSESYYFLYDIDKDGVDELVFGGFKRVTGDFDDSHAPSEIMISNIYTIADGEVVKLEELNTYQWSTADYMIERSILSNGLIRQATDYEDYPSLYYFYVKDGKLRLKYGVLVNVYSSGNKSFGYTDESTTPNNYRSISEEEYIRLRDEANGDAEPIEINWKRIDEYGR